MADCATVLDAFVGGYMGTSFRIKLEDNHLVYERLGYGYQPQERREVRPTSEEWAAFWRRSRTRVCGAGARDTSRPSPSWTAPAGQSISSTVCVASSLPGRMPARQAWDQS
jgi:hypothetical protein